MSLQSSSDEAHKLKACFKNMFSGHEAVQQHTSLLVSTHLISSISFEFFVIGVLNKHLDVTDKGSYFGVVVNHGDSCLLRPHLQERLNVRREAKRKKKLLTHSYLVILMMKFNMLQFDCVCNNCQMHLHACPV